MQYFSKFCVPFPVMMLCIASLSQCSDMAISYALVSGISITNVCKVQLA